MKLLLLGCLLVICSMKITANSIAESSNESSNSTSSSESVEELTFDSIYRNFSATLDTTRFTRELTDWVYIESKRHPNYMLYMSAPGNVYTYPKDNYVGGWNQKWSVEVDLTGTPAYKKFVNKQNSNVLYADDRGHAYGDTSKSESNQYWEMIPVDNGQYYYFKNRHNGRILDSGELENCAASSTCCCSTVHAYDVYTGTDFQKWKVY